MSIYDLFIGIDYSGAETPTSRLKELQIFAAKPDGKPEQVKTPAIAAFLASGSKNPQSVPRYWTRSEIAHWLVRLTKEGVRYLAGIDHGFSFRRAISNAMAWPPGHSFWMTSRTIGHATRTMSM